MKKNKICVYTCITGNYDNLKDIKKENGIDYYCFTNNRNIKSSAWNVIYIEDKSLSNVLLARKTKILGNDIVNSYDIALWMDGAVSFNKPIKDFINYYLKDKDNFVAFKHGERNNIHDEMSACCSCLKESKEKIINLEKFYCREGYPDNNGLIESTVYIKRPKDPLVQKTMEIWFFMVKNYSHRDQLSFNYAIYKTGLKVKWINKKVFNNEWFRWIIHNNINSDLERFCLYFGDDKKLDFENIVQGEFKKNGDLYEISVKAITDTDEITLVSFNNPMFKIKKFEMNCKKYDFIVTNKFMFKGDYICYKNPMYIKIYSSVKKGDLIKIRMNIDLIDYNECSSLFEYLLSECESEKNKRVDALNKNTLLTNEVNNILNSTSWKITKPLRKLHGITKNKDN